MFTSELLTPQGNLTCFRSPTIDCAIPESGTYIAVVAGTGPDETGGYQLQVLRLNSPINCTAVTSLGFDGAASAGTSMRGTTSTATCCRRLRSATWCGSTPSPPLGTRTLW